MSIVITTGIFPPDLGGPATYVPEIASYLSGRGHRVTVICFSDELNADDTCYPFTIVRISRRLPLIWRTLKTFLAVLRALRTADVLYINGIPFSSAQAAIFSGIPTVHKVVGDYAWERARNRGWFSGTIEQYQNCKKTARLKFLDWIRVYPLRNSDLVIVPSTYLRDLVSHWSIPDDRILIVPNAMKFYIEQNLDHSSQSPSENTILTICRLVPWKGVEGLIDALETLKNVRLIIVGDGPLKPDLVRRAICRGVIERTAFLGKLPHRDVLLQLRQASVFVLNSSYEGLPHVVIEAMSMGVPVIATTAGGTPEVVENGVTGLLVSVDDRVGLRAAIQRILDQPELARSLAFEARKMLERRFSFDIVAHQTEEILHKAINESRNVFNLQPTKT